MQQNHRAKFNKILKLFVQCKYHKCILLKKYSNNFLMEKKNEYKYWTVELKKFKLLFGCSENNFVFYPNNGLFCIFYKPEKMFYK